MCPDGLRGRVFTTVDTMLNAVMMLSMGAAAIASTRYSAREIGVVAGILSASTAIFWVWADAKGMLTEPRQDWTEPDQRVHRACNACLRSARIAVISAECADSK